MGLKNRTIETKNVLDAIVRLDRWIDENGWAGYDPYDVKGTPIFLWLQRTNLPIALKIIRRLIFEIESRYPWWVRRLFGSDKQINAKAMGLFSRAYLNLYQSEKKDSYKSKALFCLDWLLHNPSIGYSGLCWGYPFDWQSKVFIPRGTPSAVVSCTVGNGFWTAYKLLGDRQYLHVCESISNFLVNDLNIASEPDGTLCFSYTPLDDFRVHNANLFVAEFLTRIGKEVGNEAYIELSEKAAAYTLREQNPDGSLYYWGRIQNHYAPDHIDHYHSGFEMRAIYGLWQLTHDLRYKQALERYYSFYLKNLLTQNGKMIAPKMTPKSFYPVNIHACAEAILCNQTIAEDIPKAREMVPLLCDWVISKMQTNAGWFIYMIRRTKTGEHNIEIPYMRWGQAWMLLALSSTLTRSSQNAQS